jgi:hypothetical protein
VENVCSRTFATVLGVLCCEFGPLLNIRKCMGPWWSLQKFPRTREINAPNMLLKKFLT